jgi:hypothetical protein
MGLPGASAEAGETPSVEILTKQKSRKPAPHRMVSTLVIFMADAQLAVCCPSWRCPANRPLLRDGDLSWLCDCAPPLQLTFITIYENWR